LRHCAAILPVALAALLRCGRAETPPATRTLPPQKPELLHAKGPDDSDDRNNLLNFAHGAVVISRTGEVSLQNSALYAIDGDPATAWLSPPHEPGQSLVFALPATSRVRSVGLRIVGPTYTHPKSVDFELSPDGRSFLKIASFDVPENGSHTIDITPADGRFIRFSTHGANGQFVRINSVIVRGELLEPPAPGSLDGCWSINGVDASFTQRGAYVMGSVAEKNPIALDGGSDGRFYRFLWIRGPEYGVAAISVTPDGRHLSGTLWHEEAYDPFLAVTWFGEKRPCGQAAGNAVDVLATSMQRNGRYVLYGLQFDAEGRLVEPASAAMLERLAGFLRTAQKVQIEVHELGQAAPDVVGAVGEGQLG